jgi:hypothetical protein
MGTHPLLAYADDVNLLGGNIDTIKRNTETLIDASWQVGITSSTFAKKSVRWKHSLMHIVVVSSVMSQCKCSDHSLNQAVGVRCFGRSSSLDIDILTSNLYHS